MNPAGSQIGARPKATPLWFAAAIAAERRGGKAGDADAASTGSIARALDIAATTIGAVRLHIPAGAVAASFIDAAGDPARATIQPVTGERFAQAVVITVTEAILAATFAVGAALAARTIAAVAVPETASADFLAVRKRRLVSAVRDERSNSPGNQPLDGDPAGRREVSDQCIEVAFPHGLAPFRCAIEGGQVVAAENAGERQFGVAIGQELITRGSKWMMGHSLIPVPRVARAR